MKTHAQPADKVFAHAQYNVHYRSARRARWGSEAQPFYTVLLILDGGLRFSVAGSPGGDDDAIKSGGGFVQAGGVADESGEEQTSGEIRGEGALFLDPGKKAQARGEGAQFVALTLAPAFVLDCAVRARLTRDDARITFRTHFAARDERLARLARDLRDELNEVSAGQELVVAALVEQLVVHLLRVYANIRRSDELELSRAGLVDRRIRRAVELMHAHLSRDLPLEEIAAAAHVSPFHFARLFKKLTGSTPHAYLAALRAARARALLAETDLSVTEIGSRVGYSSSSHFAKAFRQATGLSPRAFRAALVRR